MVSVGQRVIRGLFIGTTIGILGFVGTYIMTKAVNILAGTTIVSEIGVGLLVFGATITSAIGIELSKDMSSESK